MDSHGRPLWALIVMLSLVTGACTIDRAWDSPNPRERTFSVTITVLDEAGRPRPDAAIEVRDSKLSVDRAGSLTIRDDQPILAMISAPGAITEPLVVHRALGGETSVALLDRTAPDGTRRTVLQFGGDTMLGRRYQEPTREDSPLVTDDESARELVAAIAPIMTSADLSVVNLESVIEDPSEEDAYPGKRFLLQSHPAVIAALHEMGIDAVSLGNNHVYDWLDAGLIATTATLDAAGIAHSGAGLDDTAARQPAMLEVGGTTVALLSYTTVTGDAVNDALPTNGERRLFSSPDETRLASGSYAPGEIWEAYRRSEADMTADARSTTWDAMTETFPELQDWVARRGHGGAARFRTRIVAEDVEAARAAGANVVVVQIHGGMQYAAAASAFQVAALRAAADSGADLVIGHHPHVLQGFEWRKGTLIAHSLGNLVFDQDLLATFPSAILRVVMEGRRVIAARAYPLAIENYRPAPVGGSAAEIVLNTIRRATATASIGRSTRVPDGSIRLTPLPSDTETAEPARIELDHGTVAIRSGSSTHASPALWLDSSGVHEFDGPRPIDPAGTTGVTAYGRDLLEWGDLEDDVADGRRRAGVMWKIDQQRVDVGVPASAPSGEWILHMESAANFQYDRIARPAGRIPLPLHRWYDAAGEPFDDRPSYSVFLTARRTPFARPEVRFDLYRFDDTDPTVDPVSERLGSVTYPLDIPDDGHWHRIRVDLPDGALIDPNIGANAALMYITLPPPDRGKASLDVDSVRLIEWRAVPAPGPTLVDAIRGTPETKVSISVGR